MRRLNHRNVVRLMYFFYSNGDKKDEVYLNLILEYVPETVYKGYINGLIRYINVTIVYNLFILPKQHDQKYLV